MATLDWVFLTVLAASLALGAWRGLVYEVLSVLGWIAAFVLAQWLAPDAAAWLPMGRSGEALRYAHCPTSMRHEVNALGAQSAGFAATTLIR